MEKKQVFVQILIFLLLFQLRLAIAYEPRTNHIDINNASIHTTSLSDYLRISLSFDLQPGLLDMQFQNNDVSRTIAEWFEEGGIREDDWDPFPFLRSFHHFHNPLLPWNEAGFNYWPWTGASSIDWAAYELTANQWSWQWGRQYFLEALTGQTQQLREARYADTFRALGQVMHLIADSSVPEHVRNDPMSFR